MNPDAVDERALGMGAYLTAGLPGTGGRLKQVAEDFVVEEVPLSFPKPQADGKYTVAAVRARNWETNRLVREIANRLNVPRRTVFFSGTKDRRAVTTQYLSVRAPLEKVQALNLGDVEVLEAFRVDRAPKIGELVGNRFHVRVRDLDAGKGESLERAGRIVDALAAVGGFPNYFGVQRFGTMRPVTHVVGEAVCRGEWERAVWTYVANPLPGDSPDVHALRARLEETRDVKQGLREYPKTLSFERRMLHHLDEHPGDHVGAIRALPRNLGAMFVHAWQSLLFNRIIAERLQRGLRLNEPLEGDFVVGVNADGMPDRTRFIPVTARNLEKVAKQCARGRAFVTGALFGHDVPLAGGVPGEIERAIVDAAGATRDLFVIPDYPDVTSPGTRRELLAPLGPVNVTAGEDENGAFVGFSFFLGKGSYATSFLREVMKAPAVAYA